MMKHQHNLLLASAAVHRRAFTLMELLVVMGIVALMGVLTAVTYRAVAKDAKLASAKNTLMAVLDNARGLAMRENMIVVVAFRPRQQGRTQYIEAVLAKWSGQSIPYWVQFSTSASVQTLDRYVVIPGVATRRLPDGIMVAGPRYFDTLDDQWVTPSYFPNMNAAGQGEAAGAMIGVMFAPNGRHIMYNSKSDAQRFFIDFDNSGRPRQFEVDVNYLAFTSSSPLPSGSATYSQAFNHAFENDEPCVSPVPYLAVFDDDHVRELCDVSRWNNFSQPTNFWRHRQADYSRYIGGVSDPAYTDTNVPPANVDRIHFNRYTGVAMR